MTEHVRVETTTDSRDEAETLATSVIRARLAACAQISGPITSTYWWEDQVEQDDEWLVTMKTATDRLDKLTAHINEQHSYDVPEVVATAIIGGSDAYLSWVADETRPGSAGDRTR